MTERIYHNITAKLIMQASAILLLLLPELRNSIITHILEFDCHSMPQYQMFGQH